MQKTEERVPIKHDPDGVCQICGVQCGIEVHHKKPLALGGTNDPDNLILLCHACHKKQHEDNLSCCIKRGMSFGKVALRDSLISYYELYAVVLDHIVDTNGYIKPNEILDIIENCKVITQPRKFSGILERRKRCQKSYESFLKWAEQKK